MKAYVKALNHLYRSHPALYQMDFHPDGFQWINCSSSQENIVVFLRKTEKPEETLLVTCNFAPVTHKQYQVGVPFYGKYKEIFNSEDVAFGGGGVGNPRVKTAKKLECDEREYSIQIDLAPLGVQIFTCTPVKEEPAKKKEEKEAKTGAGKEKKAAKAVEIKVDGKGKAANAEKVKADAEEKVVKAEKVKADGKEKAAKAVEIKAEVKGKAAKAEKAEKADAYEKEKPVKAGKEKAEEKKAAGPKKPVRRKAAQDK